MSSIKTLGCHCPAIMKSETFCSYVNDRISIDFNTGKWRNETFEIDHPGVDFNSQQFYIYKPSELFEKSVDAIVMDDSRGRKNLACSYELFDEIDETYGFDDGYFNTSDSFACTFDPKMLKNGLLGFDDSISLYNSKMPLEYQTHRSATEGSFHHIFNVTNNPGTYCVNVTTYNSFGKPVIKFWDQTPLSDKFPQLSLPVYDYICWLVIASVFLIGVGVCDALYDLNVVVLLVIAALLCKNAFDALSLYFMTRKMLVLQILISGVIGTILMITILVKISEILEENDDCAIVLVPLVAFKLPSYIKMIIQRFSVISKTGYFAVGLIMHDLVIFKHDEDIGFYLLLLLEIIGLFALLLTVTLEWDTFNQNVLIALGSLVFYIVLCVLIEFSILTRKSQFLDVFYKDPLIIIYSRLDELLIIAYICGSILWKSFCKHYQHYKVKLTTAAIQ